MRPPRIQESQSQNHAKTLRNVVASSALLVCLYDRPWKFLAWQGATVGLLSWANTSFLGIGAAAWEEIRPLAVATAPVVSVSEFLARLHPSSDANADSASPGQAATGRCSALCFGTWYFNEEDRALLHSRRHLLYHAFPDYPRLRLAHSVGMALVGLLSLVVPACLVGFCLVQVPQLQLCEVVGGSLQPEFDSSVSHHYIELKRGWKEGISFSFEMEIGQASSFAFCCGSGDCPAQAAGLPLMNRDPVPRVCSRSTALAGRILQTAR